jgi:hypothetical protein
MPLVRLHLGKTIMQPASRPGGRLLEFVHFSGGGSGGEGSVGGIYGKMGNHFRVFRHFFG